VVAEAQVARKIKRTLPGDPGTTPRDRDVASMIRVDHAGEYGAKRIYEGQLAFLKDAKTKKIVQHMAEQEQAHLDFFEKEIIARGVRPTALHPLWHAAGFALGAVTAKMGPKAAMACTVAVETVISEHYAQQLDALAKNPKEKKLRTAIKKFKAEEEEHHDTGLTYHPDHPLLTKLVLAGTRLAVRVAKRV
jgi:ubiquinone biosynthesis monooxygenase Coq7